MSPIADRYLRQSVKGPIVADVLRPTDAIRKGHKGMGFLLNQSARAMNAEIDSSLRHHGLRHLGLVLIRNVLRETAVFPDGVPAAHLATKLILTPYQVAEEASVLARDGWMRVRVDGPDMLLSCTHKAENAKPLLDDTNRWTFEQALNGFSREEIEVFSEMLRRVIRNFDAYDGLSNGE